MGYINVQRKAEEGLYSLAWDVDYWHFPYTKLDNYSGSLVTFTQDQTGFDIPQGLIKTLDTPIELANINTSVVIEIPIYYNAILTTNYHDLISVDPLFAVQDNAYSGQRRLIIFPGQSGETVVDAASGQIPNGWSIQRFTVTQSGMLWEQSTDNGSTFTTVYNLIEDLSAKSITAIKTLACAGGMYTRPAIEPLKGWTIKVDGGENLLKLTEPYYTTTRHYTASNSSCVTGGDVYCQTSSLYGANVADTYIPFDTADNWEVRTKVNLDFSQITKYFPITGSSSPYWYDCPYLQVCYGWSGAGYPDYSLNISCSFDSSGSSELKCTSSNILSSNTAYYIKYGFTGTEYYIDVNTSGWNSTFNRWASVQNSTKCYCNSSYRLAFMERAADDYTYGSMYMKDTCVYINGQKYWEAVTKDNGNSQN